MVIEAVPSEETAVTVPSAAIVATAEWPFGPVTVIEFPLWLTDIPEKIPGLASTVMLEVRAEISEEVTPSDIAGAGAASIVETGLVVSLIPAAAIPAAAAFPMSVAVSLRQTSPTAEATPTDVTDGRPVAGFKPCATKLC